MVRYSRSRGVALLTALMLSMFLLVLATGFLYFIERDSWQSLQQERALRADYAARSGLDYFYYKERTDPGVFTVGTTDGPHELQEDEFFEITKLADGGVRSRGFVQDDGGKLRAERVMVMPSNYLYLGGNKKAVYDEKL